MCTYLVKADLVVRLATARVVTHLIREGIFQAIRVADPTLNAEALRKHTCPEMFKVVSEIPSRNRVVHIE